MSLGQLTAYADSDPEDESPRSDVNESSAFASKETETTQFTSSDKNTDFTDEKVIKSSNDDLQQESYSKSKADDDPLSTGLSGVIEDEDDDRPLQPSPLRKSPPPLRVDKLKAAEGGGSGRASPASNTSGGSTRNTPVKKVNRLVSYYNEEDDMDSSSSEEEPDEVLHSEPMDTGSTDAEDESTSTSGGGASKVTSHQSSPTAPAPSTGAVVVNGIKLPAAPPGKCSTALQNKIAKIVAKGLNNNAMIQNNKAFRNPSIYEKLVDLLRLDENGTNYPIALYDPHIWGKESFYEVLAKAQQEEMEKWEKERKERTKVDFVSGTKKIGGAEEEIKKRKSRFDTGRPDTTALPSAVTKPVALVSNITAASLGATSKTTIDAFGNIHKRTKT